MFPKAVCDLLLSSFPGDATCLSNLYFFLIFFLSSYTNLSQKNQVVFLTHTSICSHIALHFDLVHITRLGSLNIFNLFY